MLHYSQDRSTFKNTQEYGIYALRKEFVLKLRFFSFAKRFKARLGSRIKKG
jgi:hypothetical protein